MNKFGLLLIAGMLSLFGFCCSTFAETIQANPDNHRHICQYKSNKNSGDSVDATFYGQKPSSAAAGKVLRTCLDGAIAIGGTREILATAWHSPTGKQNDEKQMSEKHGAAQLVFNPKTKSVETFKW